MRIFIVLMAIVLAAPAGAQNAPKTITGSGYPIDGNSLYVGKTEVRLFGIDSPEFDQPLGKEARAALDDLARGQEVSCTVRDTDRYNRAIATCQNPQAQDLAVAMLERGFATVYRKFTVGSDVADAFDDAEEEAREEQVGVWKPEQNLLELRERSALRGALIASAFGAITGSGIAWLAHWLAAKRAREERDKDDQTVAVAAYQEICSLTKELLPIIRVADGVADGLIRKNDELARTMMVWRARDPYVLKALVPQLGRTGAACEALMLAMDRSDDVMHEINRLRTERIRIAEVGVILASISRKGVEACKVYWLAIEALVSAFPNAEIWLRSDAEEWRHELVAVIGGEPEEDWNPYARPDAPA